MPPGKFRVKQNVEMWAKAKYQITVSMSIPRGLTEPEKSFICLKYRTA
jgi:hypothetical protein